MRTCDHIGQRICADGPSEPAPIAVNRAEKNGPQLPDRWWIGATSMTASTMRTDTRVLRIAPSIDVDSVAESIHKFRPSS